MINQRSKHRLKIPTPVAAAAAMVLLISSVAGPATAPTLGPNDASPKILQAENNATEDLSRVDESVNERIGVSTAPRAPKKFNISSLIFRF